MAHRYKTGTKQEVLIYMADCAIRDRLLMLECLYPDYGEPTADAQQEIDEVRATIEDFEHLKALA